MLEGPCEALMSQIKINRKKAVILVALIGFLLSIPLDLNMVTFNNFTNFITIILSPIGALLTMIVFYYVLNKDEVLIEINRGSYKKLENKFYYFAKYGFVLITIIVIILGIILGGIG